MQARTRISILAIVGAASAAIGLIQFFSFTHLERVNCRYIYNYEEQLNNLMECLQRLNSLNGSVVLLDWRTTIGDKKGVHWIGNVEYYFPFNRRVDGNYIVLDLYHRTMCEVLDVNETECERDAHQKIIDRMSADRLSMNGTSYNDIGRFNNGVSISLRNDNSDLNPFSRVSNLEGMNDRATGPFQIVSEYDDGSLNIFISPAVMTDSLVSQVRCASKDWSMIVKYAVCPFF